MKSCLFELIIYFMSMVLAVELGFYGAVFLVKFMEAV